MAWLELHQSVRDHRKTVALADSLDMPEPHVVGHLTYLWLWAIDNAPEGVLPRSARMIARAAWWTGDADQLVEALLEVGFIDETDDEYRIHDWDAYAGKLIGQRKAHAERQKKYRGQPDTAHAEHVPSTSAPHAEPQNSTEQYTTEPTEQNRTEPGQSRLRATGEPSDEHSPTRFTEFWDAYPKKVGKGAAARAFRAVRWRDIEFADLMASLARQKQCAQWQADGGRFIPNPATWLNQERWSDDPTALDAGRSDHSPPSKGKSASQLFDEARKLRERDEGLRDQGTLRSAEAQLAGEDDRGWPGALVPHAASRPGR